MIFLNAHNLEPRTIKRLATYQGRVNARVTFAERVDEAKAKFKQYNVRGNAAFDDVKVKLSAMCCGPDRCNYCEDSKADEVEHIKPKDWYPGDCFVWENYCYACGPCNGPKNNKYAVFPAGTTNVLHLERSQDAPVVAPQAGNSVLINPRLEDPLTFLFLDLIGKRYVFTEMNEDVTHVDHKRAKYTIEVLGLNSRTYLVKARKTAYNNYRARLREYVQQRDAGANQQSLDELIENLKEEHHQTVWQEMKRQRNHIAELTTLFNQAQEALQW